MSKPLWGRVKEKFVDTEPASTLPMIPPGEESAYAPTAPAPLMRVATAAAHAQNPTLHELMALARKNNRVCPQPQRWMDFYRLLEEFADGATLPSPPLTGVAWSATPALAKRMCFREQVEWAVTHDCVIAATTFLKSLQENDWHYMS